MSYHVHFPCIDNIDVPDTVIINCRKIYEDWGKTRVYRALDELMYKYDHSVTCEYDRPIRYLNLYRQAYLQSKVSFEGITAENMNEYIIRDIPVLDVDESKYCKYCGKPLVFYNNSVKPTLETTMNVLYSDEEYDDLPNTISFNLPLESYGEYRDSYTFQFTVNNVVLGTNEVSVPDNDTVFLLNKTTLSPGENTIFIKSIDFNEYPSESIPYCKNVECFTHRRFDTLRRWQFVNYNATVPVLDTSSVGYVSKTGFRLDDYDYDYNYNDSLLSMKKRGSGLGVPRTFRFDFEYKFIKNVPEYFDVYESILYRTFRRSLYSAITKGLDTVLQPNEIDVMLEMTESLSDSDKLEIIDLINVFTSFYKTYNDVRPSDDEPQKQSEYDSLYRNIVNKLIYLHDKYVLPIEFMSLFFISIAQPRRMLIYSDSLGGISSKMVYGNKLFPANEFTQIGISKKHDKPFVDTCYISKITHSISESGAVLYDNLYLLIDEDFGLEMYSFVDTSWVTDKTKYKVFDCPFDIERKFIKAKMIERNSSTCAIFVFEDRISLFDFTKNEWVKFDNDNTNSIVLVNDLTKSIVDVDYLSRSDCFVVSFGDYVSLISLDGTTNCTYTCAESDQEYDYDEYTDTYVEYGSDTQVALSYVDKVFANQSILIERENNKIDAIDYITLIDNFGNIQILKIVLDTEISIFKTIRFSNKYRSKVASLFYVYENQKIFLAYENMRILVLDTNIYNPIIVQSGNIDGDEKIVYATKTKSKYMDYMTYVTNKNDSKYAFAFYQKGINGVSDSNEPVRHLITNGSNVVTYDDIIVFPNNIDFWTRDIYRLSQLQQKERYATQR